MIISSLAAREKFITTMCNVRGKGEQQQHSLLEREGTITITAALGDSPPLENHFPTSASSVLTAGRKGDPQNTSVVGKKIEYVLYLF